MSLSCLYNSNTGKVNPATVKVLGNNVDVNAPGPDADGVEQSVGTVILLPIHELSEVSTPVDANPANNTVLRWDAALAANKIFAPTPNPNGVLRKDSMLSFSLPNVAVNANLTASVTWYNQTPEYALLLDDTDSVLDNRTTATFENIQFNKCSPGRHWFLRGIFEVVVPYTAGAAPPVPVNYILEVLIDGIPVTPNPALITFTGIYNSRDSTGPTNSLNTARQLVNLDLGEITAATHNLSFRQGVLTEGDLISDSFTIGILVDHLILVQSVPLV